MYDYMYMIHDSACSSLTQEGFKMNLSRKTGTAVEVKPKGIARFYVTDWLVFGRLVGNQAKFILKPNSYYLNVSGHHGNITEDRLCFFKIKTHYKMCRQSLFFLNSSLAEGIRYVS